MSKQETATESRAVVSTTVTTREFAAELEWVNRFTERQSTIPIVQNVLMVKSGNTLTLTATDLETAGVSQVPCDGGEDFRVAVPVKKLLKYLAGLADPFVTLDFTQHGATSLFRLTHGPDGVVEIHAMGADHFPELPKPVLEGVLSGLLLAVPRSIVAVTQEESRFAMNGALLEVRDGARIVATDGHRLSICEIQSKDLAPCRKLIPLGCLKELAAMAEDSFHFGYNADHMFFLSQNSMRRIVSRTLTGNFPDHERVMPKVLPFETKLDQAAMAQAVKRALVFADERSRACTFELAAGRMEVSAQEIGESGAKLRVASTWDGEPFRIGLNGGYVQDFLDYCPQGEFDFKFTDNKSVSLWATDGWQYLVMPLRLE